MRTYSHEIYSDWKIGAILRATEITSGALKADVGRTIVFNGLAKCGGEICCSRKCMTGGRGIRDARHGMHDRCGGDAGRWKWMEVGVEEVIE